MSERCLLPITIDNPSDRNDIFWESDIPDECYRCLLRALLGPEVETTYYNVADINDGEAEYTMHGIRREGDGSRRCGIEEHGIEADLLDSQNGVLLSKSKVYFNCRRD